MWNALACLALVAVLAATGSTAAMAAAEKNDGDTVPVDLNSATREQLMQIKGIGPSLADRIIEFRKENGPYRRVEDILKVRGIGEKSLSKLKPYLKVGKTGA
jgi:competence protein ComEA